MVDYRQNFHAMKRHCAQKQSYKLREREKREIRERQRERERERERAASH